jgi:hypothetical protein
MSGNRRPCCHLQGGSSSCASRTPASGSLHQRNLDNLGTAAPPGVGDLDTLLELGLSFTLIRL